MYKVVQNGDVDLSGTVEVIVLRAVRTKAYSQSFSKQIVKKQL